MPAGMTPRAIGRTRARLGGGCGPSLACEDLAVIQSDLLSTRKKRAVQGKLSEAEQAAIRAAELGGKLSVIPRNSLPATPSKRPSRHQFGRVSMFAGSIVVSFVTN